ncbi:MAG: hypothetical protein JW910_14190 [Anaerolineae bacterium]|nr:hypothetical protein [Anaerolineae bacterium]
MEITLNLHVEDLLAAHPAAAGFLADRKVVCIVCGEAYWGTLGELMAHKGIADPDGLVADLNDFLSERQAEAE